jgi:hypothetical protein
VTEERPPRQRDRRRLLVLLAAAAILLVAGVTLAVWLAGGDEPEPPATAPTAEPGTTTPETTAPETTTTAPPPPTEPAGPAPQDTRAEATPVSARLTWRTTVPTTGHVAVGSPELGPTRWLPPTALGTEHALSVGSLSPRRTFRVWIRSRAEDGAQAETSFDVTTPAPGGAIEASTGGGLVHLNGQPWFPLMVFGLCSNHIETALSADITLVSLNPCGGLEEQLRALDGRALSAGASTDEPTDDPRVIGWFYPDEADAQGMTGDTLPVLPGGPTFLTLTNHFYSGAEPLPQGRGMYPGLVARTDVVGFDLYPLQEWCQRDRLVDVELAQRELVELAAGKPTFQWIEASEMKCRETPGQEVTPESVRAESWLAMIGGAVGLGFFPAAWTAEVEQAIRRVGEESAILAPSLLGRRLATKLVDGPPTLRVGAWTDGRTIVVAAVNASRRPARARLSVEGVGNRPLSVLGESRTVPAAGGVVGDSFAPLAVHVYVLPPPDA